MARAAAAKAPATDIETLLERTPGFRDGRPCIRGTGITVHNIAARFQNGDSIETIASDLPRATLAGIHAALAHYFLHRDEVEADWAHDEATLEEDARSVGAVIY
jgi:uncharacterized protein (DUF433 family)